MTSVLQYVQYPQYGTAMTSPSGLTNLDREHITRARKLADLDTIDAIRQHTGEDDTTTAMMNLLGETRWLLCELANAAEHAAGGDDPHNVAGRLANLERRASGQQDDGRELIAQARDLGPALRASNGDRDRLAGWLLAELADLAERQAGKS